MAGLKLIDLANTYGTPLYIYDAATLRGKTSQLHHELQQHYPGSSEISYAAKAYFSPGLARHIHDLGLGVDVVSLGELDVARKAGFDPDQVHLHGNNKNANEIEAAVQWGIHAIVIDYLDEIDLIESRAASSKKKVQVWIRITPGINVDTHPYRKTGHAVSKFGLSIENGDALQGIKNALRSPHLDLIGLHFHLGSQIFDIDPYRAAIIKLFDLAESCEYSPLEISPGGGWGVPYTLSDPALDIGTWISAISQTLMQHQSSGKILPKLVVETGRWLIAQAGVAIYSIGSIKRGVDGVRILAIDGGMADNPRPMLYQSEYTMSIAENHDSKSALITRVVGRFCESGDEMIPLVKLPDAQRGDHLIVPVSGAYHLSMASNYNLAARPCVLWLEDGKVEVLQKRIPVSEDPWWMGG